MSCSEVTPWIEAFLDGELPAEQTLDMEQHLAACGECGERLRFEGALRASLRRAVIRDAIPSAHLEARLAGALRAERERLLERPTVLSLATIRRRNILMPLMLAAAATFSFVVWMNARFKTERSVGVTATDPALSNPNPTSQAAQMNAEQVLDELVDYHAEPPVPQITEPEQLTKLEPEVGVPLRLPALNQYGASWEGGSVMPMKNQHAAIFRYRISNRPVTVYVYDARRVPLRGVLEPRVVHNQPIHVGERRGYSIAAREQRGVGYAVASDMSGDESAELVSTIY